MFTNTRVHVSQNVDNGVLALSSYCACPRGMIFEIIALLYLVKFLYRIEAGPAAMSEPTTAANIVSESCQSVQTLPFDAMPSAASSQSMAG